MLSSLLDVWPGGLMGPLPLNEGISGWKPLPRSPGTPSLQALAAWRIWTVTSVHRWPGVPSNASPAAPQRQAPWQWHPPAPQAGGALLGARGPVHPLLFHALPADGMGKSQRGALQSQPPGGKVRLVLALDGQREGLPSGQHHLMVSRYCLQGGAGVGEERDAGGQNCPVSRNSLEGSRWPWGVIRDLGGIFEMGLHRAGPVWDKSGLGQKRGSANLEGWGLCSARGLPCEGSLGGSQLLGWEMFYLHFTLSALGIPGGNHNTCSARSRPLMWAEDSIAVPMKQNPHGREGREGSLEEEAPSDLASAAPQRHPSTSPCLSLRICKRVAALIAFQVAFYLENPKIFWGWFHPLRGKESKPPSGKEAAWRRPLFPWVQVHRDVDLFLREHLPPASHKSGPSSCVHRLVHSNYCSSDAVYRVVKEQALWSRLLGSNPGSSN